MSSHKSQYILTLDQGTTGSTVSLMDHGGSLVASCDQDFEQIFPKPGWVEHDPEQIWSGIESLISKTLGKAKVSGSQIKAIGITNQRETVVAWNKKNGKAAMNAIVWQCRRTTDLCQKLKKKGLEKKIKQKTGLVLDPYFSGSKIQWMLNHSELAKKWYKQKELQVGTIDSFLIFRLSGFKSHATDVSNASRTMLMNLQSLAWDDELLKIFKISKEILPEIKSSNANFGITKGLSCLPDGIPIHGVAGDQQSALFGQACWQAGEAKCTFGTGSFLLMNTGNKIIRSKSGLLTTVAWQLENQKINYALEGGAFICGAAVQWLRDGLKIIQSSSEVEALAKKVSSCDGVQFVPALTGLGAPHWNPDARGIITGLTRGSTSAHIARATLEAMALQNCDILLAMQKDLGKKLKSLKVDGGAVANSLLMQMQSDFMGCEVQRPQWIESTSMGAGYLAGLGSGFWKSQAEIAKIWQLDQVFKSEISAAERRARLKLWKTAIRQAMVQ